MTTPAFSIHPTEPRLRIYRRRDAVVFRRAADEFGGLSNMTSEFPVVVGDVRACSSEALYQACRFPHLPEVQLMILSERSPMTAKMKSKPHRGDSRADWEQVRVAVMRWCLRVKLVTNWGRFGSLLLATGERPIVEDSSKDTFWGAKLEADDELIGENVLGRLLMELRELLRARPEQLHEVSPPSVSSFLLLGQPVPVVTLAEAPPDMPRVSANSSGRSWGG